MKNAIAYDIYPHTFTIHSYPHKGVKVKPVIMQLSADDITFQVNFGTSVGKLQQTISHVRVAFGRLGPFYQQRLAK